MNRLFYYFSKGTILLFTTAFAAVLVLFSLIFNYHRTIIIINTSIVLIFLIAVFYILNFRQERNNLFQQFFFDGPVPKFLLNPENGEIMEANKAASDFYGFPLKELKTKNIADIDMLSPADLKSTIRFALEHGKTSFILKHRLSNGSIKYVEIFSGPVILKKQKLLFSIIHDVTNKIEAEKSLKESENKFRNTFFTIPDALIISRKKDGLYIDVNDGFSTMTGFSRQDVIGKTYKELTLWKDPDDREKFVNKLDQSGSIENFENCFRHKDGQLFTVLISAKIFSLNDVSHIIWVIHDITKRKNMEVELIKSKDRAEESDRLKTAFLNNISHEVRTPLNAIMGFSNLLKEKPDDFDEFVDIINISSKHLLKVIEDVLLISQLESGSVKLTISSFDLYKMLQDLFDDFVQKSKVKVLCKCGILSGEFIIKGDEDKLKQVFSVLISNAIKYTFNGEISFGYTQDNSKIRFFVKDTGIGIPVQEKNKIFRSFYQVQNEQNIKNGGNGLGLTIAQKLIEIMNGRIWFESKLDHGSTFYFEIPLILSGISTANSFNKERVLNGLKVLIVEDEIMNFQYLDTILKMKNAQTIWASNGSEALKIIKQNKPNIILMDLKMPVMDGFQSTRLIKKIYPDIPIIAQTAYTLPNEKEEAFAAGCIEFISKPIQKEELFSLIQKIIAHI